MAQQQPVNQSQQQPQQQQPNYNGKRGRGAMQESSWQNFLDEWFAVTPGRPGRSLRNFFITYPICLGIIGVAVQGNPLSKFFNSLGAGGSRMVGGVITENRDNWQESANSIYGQPTQPGALNPQNGRQAVPTGGNRP